MALFIVHGIYCRTIKKLSFWFSLDILYSTFSLNMLTNTFIIRNIEKKNLFILTLPIVVSVHLQKALSVCLVYLVQAFTSVDHLTIKLVYYSLSLFSSVFINNVLLITSIFPN